jgi:ELWxxDGT repeat protein
MRGTRDLLSLTVALGCAATLAASPGTAAAAGTAGTAGTAAGARPVAAMVADLAPGPLGSDPQNLTVMNGTLFFTAGGLLHGRQLWKSDGTAAGTVALTHVPGPAGAAPEDLTVADGELFFSAWDPRHGRELWHSDGTPAGTTLVSDIVAGPLGSSPQDITYAVGQQFEPAQQVLVYFSGWDPRHGRQLWKSDGTAAGTVMVSDVNPGPAAGLRPAAITTDPFTGAAFSGDDGTHGREPWVTNGTAAGTHMFADLNPGPAASDPRNFTTTTQNEGILARFWYTYFTAGDGTHGREMFVLYGPPAPAVYDINPGPASSNAGPFTEVVNGIGLISAGDGTHGRELFEPGVLLPFEPPNTHAKLVADINPGPASSSPVLAPAPALIGYQEFADIPESTTRTYMSAGDGAHGRELWEADEVITLGAGESSGLNFGISAVRPVADIVPGGRGSDPRGFAAVGGRPVFGADSGDSEVFSADDGAHGREVWISAGWDTNTAMAADINPGPASSGPAGITVIGQTAYFSADDGRHGRELWKLTVPPAPLTEAGLEGGKVTTGSQVPFYVGILAVPGMAQPSGEVTFYQDGIPFATAALTPGFAGIMTASVNVTTSAGSHQITGVYSGDGSYAGTTSSTMVYTGT